MKLQILICIQLYVLLVHSQNERRVGKLTEVYAWKQLSYNINGNILSSDRLSSNGLLDNVRLRRERVKRQDKVYFQDRDEERDWTKRYSNSNFNAVENTQNNIPANASSYFIQYNNVPMGAERVGDRLFITVPRRRYGIPSTLNYIDLTSERSRSPPLTPYPNPSGGGLISVYRTRADECGRLWMVDTGLMEIPDSPQQIQRPAIVIFDLQTDRQILRYEFRDSDVPANNTPTGLASITIDNSRGCSNAYAYVPDLTTYGLIVFSLRDTDSWRLTHNYFHFNPAAASLNIAGDSFPTASDIREARMTILDDNPPDDNPPDEIVIQSSEDANGHESVMPIHPSLSDASVGTGSSTHSIGQRFQWNDGIFSITLTPPQHRSCRTAYFHPMVSTEEFSVSTCVLNNRTAARDANFWEQFSIIGDRGTNSQSTMHDIHGQTNTLFFADIGRDGVSCWNTNKVMNPDNVVLLAQDQTRLSYPADLHITGDELWVISNTLPRFGYSQLDTNVYNFYVYRGSVPDLISGTKCEDRASSNSYNNLYYN